MELEMKTTSVNSTRTFSAIRAHRTMVAKLLDRTVNEVARAGLKAALDRYDTELVGAPAPIAKASVDRKVSALRAHRTMAANKLTGSRGKVRTAILAKIAHYDALLSTSA
jgi:hypothetical protein